MGNWKTSLIEYSDVVIANVASITFLTVDTSFVPIDIADSVSYLIQWCVGLSIVSYNIHRIYKDHKSNTNEGTE